MLAQTVQAIAERSIVNGVTNANECAAQQTAIERKFRCNFFAGDALKSLRHFGFLLVVQVHRGKNFRFGDSLPVAQYVLKSRDDFRQFLHPMVVNNYKQEISRDFADPEMCGNLLSYATFGFDGGCGTCEEISQLRRFLIRRKKILQLLESGSRGALSERNVRKGVRILQAGGLQFGLPCSVLTNPAISASWVCGVSCLASNDSAPSSASFAASVFNSMRAARSAAAIS